MPRDMLQCDNCERIYHSAEALRKAWPDIPDLRERIEPGGIVPAGECNECGALVYAMKTPKLMGWPEAYSKAIDAAEKLNELLSAKGVDKVKVKTLKALAATVEALCGMITNSSRRGA